MERQKSFSFKSTRFLLFSVTIFTSLILLSFFSVWFVKSTPFVPQQVDLINLNTSSTSSISLGLRSISVQVLTSTAPSSIGNSSAPTVGKPNMALTHFRKPENTSGFEIIKVIGEKGIENQVAENGEKAGDGAGVIFTDMVGSDSGVSSAPTEKKPNLDHTHFRKPENTSGFEIITGIGEKGNENQVAENGEKGGNFTALLESDSGVSVQEIEVLSSERAEEKRKKVDSVEKIEGRSSKRAVEKKIEATSVKKIEALSNGKIEEKRVRECDVTKGKWVYDESYPLYTNTSCPFIDEGFNCQSNGRLDKGYMKWRWQPQDCDIPRFNATKMLELIRGKRLVFVGDSINRNQWESMLCLLTGAIKDPKKVYETHGRRITKEKGIYSFKFVDYKCTIEYYVTHFLVHESKARVGQKRVPTLRIDAIDHGSSRWRGADILVFNTAHWWSHYKTKSGINYYQEGNQVHPRLDVSTAFRRALTTWASWVDNRINPRKTKVFFRSSAPSHFRGGQWNSGGHCREATAPLNETSITDYSEKNGIVEDVIKQMKTPVTLLNITGLSGYRIDGHPSVYGRSGKRFSLSIQDCSHWCLPGIPDMWNELLYFHLTMKQT